MRRLRLDGVLTVPAVRSPVFACARSSRVAVLSERRIPAASSLVAALCAAALLAACGKPEGGPGGPGQMPPPEVSVVGVQPRDIPVVLEYVGQTEGMREVEVRPRVGGILLKWNYTEGSTVRAGQSLFTIDPVPYQTLVARAEAELASTRAQHAQATREIARLKPLLDKGMVSQKAYDDAVSAEEVAAAQIKAAEAALKEARLNLGYTRVEAPIGGVTSRALKSEGSLVEAQNTLLTTISQIDPIRVIFNISDAEQLRFRTEAAAGRLRLPKNNRYVVTLKLADGSTSERPGVVDFSDVRVNPTTGTSEVRAVLPNPDHRLRPGQFVRVTLKGAEYVGALAVPQRAVLEGPQGKIVMTVNDKNVVEPRPVQVGEWSGQEWVITGGLNPGDKVIVDGVVKARPGSPVTIAQAPAAGGAPPAAPAEQQKPAPPEQQKQ
jgi:membrane fusion protein (multidrug efflux system)